MTLEAALREAFDDEHRARASYRAVIEAFGEVEETFRRALDLPGRQALRARAPRPRRTTTRRSRPSSGS